MNQPAPRELNAANFELPFDTQLSPGSVKKAMKEAEAGSRDLWQVPIENLRMIDNFNVRVKNEAYSQQVRSLADSMKTEGFYQDSPISGYVGQENGEQVIYYYDGHRRIEAAKLAIKEGAEIVKIPVVVTSGVSMEDLTVALVRKNSGQPLTPFEIGLVCKRLARYGWETPAIAERLGITEQYVNNLMSLIAAPIEIRQMVINDQISATTAIEVIGKHKDKALDVLTKAQERAAEKGSKKVTAKHVDPASKFKKACRDRAEDMFTTLEKVSLIEVPNQGEISLPQAVFDEVYALVQEIKENGS